MIGFFESISEFSRRLIIEILVLREEGMAGATTTTSTSLTTTTRLNMLPITFVTPNSFSVRPNRHTRSTSITIKPISRPITPIRPSPITCENKPPQPNEQQQQQQLIPESTLPNLLKRPESVLTLLSVSLIATAAYLTRTARHITTAITKRMRFYLESERLASRIQSRLKEREFLHSALEATLTTIGHTKSMISTQEKRAENAENTLQRLERQSSNLLQLEKHRDSLTIELNRVQNKLSELEKTLSKDQHKIQDDKVIIQNEYHNKLLDLKYQILSIEEQQRLTRELNRKQKLNSSVQHTKNRIEKIIQDKQNRLESLENGISQNLQGSKQNKKQIEQLASLLHQTDQQLYKQRGQYNKIHQDNKIDSNIDQVQTLISSLTSKQKQIKTSIDEKGQSAKTMERRKKLLQNELEQADQRLSNMREKINQFGGINQQQRNENDTNQDMQFQITDDPTSTTPTQILAVSQQKNEKQRTKIIASKGEGIAENEIVQSSKTPIKRPRGRPRKKDVTGIIQGNKEESKSEEPKPKRGRGRPRKNPVADLTTVTESAPKRKRGRPKKISNLPQRTTPA